MQFLNGIKRKACITWKNPLVFLDTAIILILWETIMRIKENESNVQVISAKGNSLFSDMKELWEYRELIKMFVKRNFKTMYAQTILGPAWFIINALLSTSVLTLVFGKIANISTEGAPQYLFYMIGNILWAFFSACVATVSDTFISNAHLMGKVYFPRMSVPISTVISKLIQFFIQFALFLIFYFVYLVGGGASVSLTGIWLIPILLLETSLLGMACGMIITALTTKYRDLRVLVSFGLQLWMYATPIVYPASVIPQKWKVLLMLNPMAPIVEAFRGIFFGGTQIPFIELGISMATTGLVLFAGIYLFQRAQRTFADTV